ncbi:type II secretion system F family protein [Rhizobacter sp. J219]|uniref:type II secretion system F family protein n=1 Tax=Rhizobacter sp. J219 TaxID=2898430 RepID=UPI0021509F8A|nr:type II secretion system F family protein [Rhizobacter sp. J219]MCR5885815.1 type II secretion system F family protein [Rhizobacter sp. J219]
MPQFTYTARDAGGDLLQGVLEGDSAGAVAAELQRAGSTPLEIALATAVGASMASKQISFGKKERVKHEDLLMFSRQLHTLLKAGIALTRALGGLQESASPAMKDVIRQTRESLESGNEMSTSLAKQTGVFSAFYVAMVRVGEMTGRLDEVFLRLFHHLEFEKLMRDQVKSALRYPSFVVAVMIIAIGVVNVFVIPAFQRVFDNLGSDLPFMTQLLVGFSKFTLVAWPYLLVGAVGGFFAFKRWTATEDGGYTWDKLKLKFPIAGKIIRKATLARFSRSFALALKSGVPVVQAMMVVANTVDNHFYARAIEKMREGVERGDSLLRTAAASGIFTPVVLQMIAVGEESGTLDEMLGEVADFYQQEVEYELKSLSAQIEPILIIFLGVLVLILALGVFLPIWDLGKAAIK